MDYFAGLDVSVKETSICIMDDAGKIVREVKVASEPEALLQVLTNPAYHFKRIGLEAGPLSQWLFSALAEMGLPVICVETRHIQSLQSIDTTSVGSILNGPDFGDVFLRTKMNLFGNDAGPAGFALMPYVKLPSSAPVISNGAVEGGLIAPLALRPEDFIITFMTELDVLKAANGDGRYANFVNLVGASHPIPGLNGVNGMVELYSSAGTDPGTPPIYTFDLGMNFRFDQHTILDVGLNLGLNKAAPKAQVYSGISLRF
jgi:hypothetical protein